MCRVFGAVRAEQGDVRYELLEAENPMIRQSREHDSGWGEAVYKHADGSPPHVARFPQAAYEDGEFQTEAEFQGRIFNVHVRRATLGGLTLANTHPFCHENYSFCHNGTVIDCHKLLEPGVRKPEGETDSEIMFNFLMRDYEPDHPIESLRRAMTAIVERSAFSGVNFLFSDGYRLFAYRLGIFDLRWLARPGELLVASERITDDDWIEADQNELLILDPENPEEPGSRHLLADDVVAGADIQKFELGSELRGAERGAFAAERAAKLAAASK